MLGKKEINDQKMMFSALHKFNNNNNNEAFKAQDLNIYSGALESLNWPQTTT